MMEKGEWTASQYLDDDRWGVLSYDGSIIISFAFGLNLQQCNWIAEAHNRDLATKGE